MRRTSLASATGAGELAHELREAGDHAAHRNHRQTHGTVAHRLEPALRVLATAGELAGSGHELVAERDEGVHRLGSCVRQRRTGGLGLGGGLA